MNSNPNENPDLEAPLAGLVSKPLHEMTDEELREQVKRKRELQLSSQARQAFFRGKKDNEPQSTSVLDEL